MLGGVLLVLVFRDVDLDEFWSSIRSVDQTWWSISVVTVVGLHLTRAWRWGRIVHRIKPLPQRDVLSANSMGFLAILVMPFRLGEMVRPYILHERHGVPFGSALYSVVVERTVDILALGMLFLIAVLFADLPLESFPIGDWDVRFVVEGRKAILIALTPFGGCLLAFLLLQDRAVRWTTAVVGMVHEGLARKTAAMMQSFLDGVRTMKDPRFGLEMAVSTTLIWALNVACLWSLFIAFRFEGLGPMTGLVLLVVMVVGSLLPAPPMFAGVYEVFVVVGLALFGVGRDEATAYAVVSHMSMITVVVGLGLVFLWLDGVPVSRIFRLTPLDTTTPTDDGISE